MSLVLPALYLALVAWLLWDCRRLAREPHWYLVVLIPVVGPIVYLARHAVASTDDEEVGDDIALDVAVAALLSRLMYADDGVDPAERQVAVAALAEHFALDATAAESLLVRGEAVDREAVSVAPFTRTINDAIPGSERVRIVELMWRVVYADGVKDQREEHLVRKISGLLYVSQVEFVEARRTVVAKLSMGD